MTQPRCIRETSQFSPPSLAFSSPRPAPAPPGASVVPPPGLAPTIAPYPGSIPPAYGDTSSAPPRGSYGTTRTSYGVRPPQYSDTAAESAERVYTGSSYTPPPPRRYAPRMSAQDQFLPYSSSPEVLSATYKTTVISAAVRHDAPAGDGGQWQEQADQRGDGGGMTMRPRFSTRSGGSRSSVGQPPAGDGGDLFPRAAPAKPPAQSNHRPQATVSPETVWGSGFEPRYSAMKESIPYVSALDYYSDPGASFEHPQPVDPVPLISPGLGLECYAPPTVPDDGGLGLEGYAPPTVPDDSGLGQQYVEKDFITRVL